MFNSISWQDFLFALLLLLGGYYVIIVLLFYRVELLALLKGENGSKANVNEQPKPVDNDKLLGKIATPVPDEDDEFIAEEDQIQFHSGSNTGLQDLPPATPLIGDVSEFLSEFKTLCQVVATNGASLKEAEPMFKTLLARHTQLAQTPFVDAINMHLYGICKETCAFDLELKRVNTWWAS